MKILKAFIIITVVILTSCVNLHKNFSYYREPIKCNNSLEVRIDGIYFAIPGQESDKGIVFYNNGMVYIYNRYTNDAEMFWLNPSKFMKYEFPKQFLYNYIKKDLWGHYIIRNDSIFIQYFHRNIDYWIKRNITELYGIIKDNTNIYIYKEKWTKNAGYHSEPLEKIYNTPILYKFYQTDIKPDSTNAWFYKKRWYEKWQEERDTVTLTISVKAI